MFCDLFGEVIYDKEKASSYHRGGFLILVCVFVLWTMDHVVMGGEMTVELWQLALAFVLVTLSQAVPIALALFFFVRYQAGRPYYTSTAGRKARQDTEDSIARTIPHQKMLADKLKILNGVRENVDMSIAEIEDELLGIDKLNSDMMNGLEDYIRK